MSEKSKYSILVNEIMRRLKYVNIENSEKVEFIDHYTKQLRILDTRKVVQSRTRKAEKEKYIPAHRKHWRVEWRRS